MKFIDGANGACTFYSNQILRCWRHCFHLALLSAPGARAFLFRFLHLGRYYRHIDADSRSRRPRAPRFSCPGENFFLLFDWV